MLKRELKRLVLKSKEATSWQKFKFFFVRKLVKPTDVLFRNYAIEGLFLFFVNAIDLSENTVELGILSRISRQKQKNR